MKNILERINELLCKESIGLDEFKQVLIREFNNTSLVDIAIRKGKREGNLTIEDGQIKLVRQFNVIPIKSTIDLCLSIPPFEKIALKTILETSRVNIVTIENAFISLIKESVRSIKICSPFFELGGWKRLEKDFIDFAKRGGTIQIICRELEKSQKRKNDIKKIIEEMKLKGLSKNIEFKEYHFIKENIESSSHAKLFISDNQAAYIGSGEIRKNSFDINFEMGVIIRGDLVKDIKQVFDFMFDSSKELTFENEK